MHKDRAASNVDESRQVDYIKDEVATRLVDRLLDIKRKFGTIVEVGAGCGHIAKSIDSDIADTLIMCENSGKFSVKIKFSFNFWNIDKMFNPTSKFIENSLNRDSNVKYDVKVERRKMDEEIPDFEENSCEAIVSNLSLHWVNDLVGSLIKIRSALIPDGVFLASLFGGDTLFELRTSLQLAEQERLGGISPHISPMVDPSDMGGLLTRAGLSIPTVDVDKIIVNYPSMFHLMADLNAMGEGNAIMKRPRTIRRSTLYAAASIYKELYGNEDGSIQATFEIVYIIGWKPDPSQPKPLKRGSAEVSMKSVLE
ncbi:NADH dehydrogenase [ubiquinone] 1 alpha subcomplex assembly factor 5 [Smittium mucronatum]|uniref:NADH dehydrogenase [ubiquinone] 1 alpha subcomplex assembly factor 5 n=1 Tax=Smittium mucronatum TaxID=133383 RepID=A0A1R0H3K1_9FUNG|nr:NADH dehydrogenase [ubiquinone] 1 alpha subcomplex assembly factor 5 [Smittium mucronatum]